MVETKFDILVEKNYFLHLAKCLLKIMQDYIRQDEQEYEQYKTKLNQLN
jgi:hypothetical protein